MSLENFSNSEQNGLRESELPQSHREGIDPSRLEGLNETEKNLLVGEHVFEDRLEHSPGLKGAFREIAEEGSKEEFASLYERYVDDSKALKAQDPQTYAFFRDRIFHGKEYNLNGMEKFMRDTAPNRAEQTAEAKPNVELNASETTLPKTELHHAEITNCQRPFSYGNLMEMVKKMDFDIGDTALLPLAPDRMVAVRNLMALCGKEFSEADVTKHAVDNNYMAYDPLYLKGFSHSANDTFLPFITNEMGDIRIEPLEFTEAENPAETMAALLDQGHRGMVTYNPALLYRTDAEAATPKGKLLEKFPHSANETSTLLCAVRDGNTGKTAGFMICDSAREHKSRYVEADQLVKAMDVKHGQALFTKQPYLDK